MTDTIYQSIQSIKLLKQHRKRDEKFTCEISHLFSEWEMKYELKIKRRNRRIDSKINIYGILNEN